jgi:hypothetical protein
MEVGGQHHTSAALFPGHWRGTHRTGGCVSPTADLYGCGKSPQPVASRYSD